MNPGRESLVRLKFNLAKGVTSVLLVALLVFLPFQLGIEREGWIEIKAAIAYAKSGPGKDGDGGGHGGGDDDDDSGSGNSGNDNSGNDNNEGANHPVIVRIKLTNSGVEIRYADGSREEIKNGRYRYKAASGKTVTSRRATGADLARLRARANGISIDSIRRPRNLNATSVNAANISGNNIKLTYTNGWSEEISSGQYKLKDQYNRTVVSRPASKADIQRMRQVAGR